eukprot:Gb_19931 [translate_table: standard]
MTVASHDTTGGMATKISEAAMIAKFGIDVYIVQAGTDHSLKALKGELKDENLDEWIGTILPLQMPPACLYLTSSANPKDGELSNVPDDANGYGENIPHGPKNVAMHTKDRWNCLN